MLYVCCGVGPHGFIFQCVTEWFSKLLLLNYYYPAFCSSYYNFVVCVYMGGRCGVKIGSHVVKVGFELSIQLIMILNT